MNTKTKEGARNKGNPYFLRVPWNKGGLVNAGPDSQWRSSVDLSWPCGASVTTGVQKDIYLNSKFALTYPSVDQIVNKLLQLGPGSLI